MSQQYAQRGFRPPQQARSRASLRKVLASAEHVLDTCGIDEFTIAAVAEHAGMSVGTIYRRFTSKEQLLHAVKDQLLEQLETNVVEALRSAEPGLASVLDTFTRAMANTFSQHTRIFPDLLSGQRAEGLERGLQALATIQQALAEAAGAHVDDIRRSDPELALRVASRTIISSCVHRAATYHAWPDDLSWTTWATETTEMTMAYLSSPQTPRPPNESGSRPQ